LVHKIRKNIGLYFKTALVPDSQPEYRPKPGYGFPGLDEIFYLLSHGRVGIFGGKPFIPLVIVKHDGIN
jgi:hypothetical protein